MTCLDSNSTSKATLVQLSLKKLTIKKRAISLHLVQILTIISNRAPICSKLTIRVISKRSRVVDRSMLEEHKIRTRTFKHSTIILKWACLITMIMKAITLEWKTLVVQTVSKVSILKSEGQPILVVFSQS